MANDNTMVTPLGTVFYAGFLSKPNKYDNVSVTLGFTDEALKEFKEMYDEKFSEYYSLADLKRKKAVKAYPKEKKDPESGLTLISFDQKAQRTLEDGTVINFSIGLLDWKNNPIEGVLLANGTIGKVLLSIYAPEPYEGKAKLRLQPKFIKIKTLIPYTKSAFDAFGDEEDEDGYVHGATSIDAEEEVVPAPKAAKSKVASKKAAVNSDVDDSLL